MRTGTALVSLVAYVAACVALVHHNCKRLGDTVVHVAQKGEAQPKAIGKIELRLLFIGFTIFILQFCYSAPWGAFGIRVDPAIRRPFL